MGKLQVLIIMLANLCMGNLCKHMHKNNCCSLLITAVGYISFNKELKLLYVEIFFIHDN